MKRLIYSLWVPLAAVLFSVACPSESPALTATDFNGTWSGTWTSQFGGNGSGAITLALSGTDTLLGVDLTGTLTMTGKSTVSRVPIQGSATGGQVLMVGGTPPGELAFCRVDLSAISPDLSATRIGGAYLIVGGCQFTPIDAGFFDIRKVAALPALTLSLNQSTFRSGNTLRVGLRAQNPGVPINADFYFGVLLPDGVTALFLTSLSPLNGVVTRLDADPRTFRPLLANVQLPQGLNTVLTDFFVYTFAGGEQAGTYAAFSFFTPPGAFNDGRVDPGDVLVIDVRPFGFSP